jgi:transposase
MQDLFNSLSEKDRRRYAAVEALKLGYGGITYICKLFLCDEKTVQRGLRELRDPESLSQESIRLPGGGRPSKIDIYSDIDEKFLRILRDHTAGSPTDSSIKWTDLSRKEIQEKLSLVGIDVSRQIVKKLLHKHGFVRRKLQKKSHRAQ